MLNVCTQAHSDADSSRIPTKVSEMSDLPVRGTGSCTDNPERLRSQTDTLDTRNYVQSNKNNSNIP